MSPRLLISTRCPGRLYSLTNLPPRVTASCGSAQGWVVWAIFRMRGVHWEGCKGWGALGMCVECVREARDARGAGYTCIKEADCRPAPFSLYSRSHKASCEQLAPPPLASRAVDTSCSHKGNTVLTSLLMMCQVSGMAWLYSRANTWLPVRGACSCQGRE